MAKGFRICGHPSGLLRIAWKAMESIISTSYWKAVGGKFKRKRICAYIQLIHSLVQQKLTQHCKLITLQLKKKQGYSLMIANQSQHPFLLLRVWYGNVRVINPEFTDPSLVTGKENNLFMREVD